MLILSWSMLKGIYNLLSPCLWDEKSRVDIRNSPGSLGIFLFSPIFFADSFPQSILPNIFCQSWLFLEIRSDEVAGIWG
jgi:hypothetical protein